MGGTQVECEGQRPLGHTSMWGCCGQARRKSPACCWPRRRGPAAPHQLLHSHHQAWRRRPAGTRPGQSGPREPWWLRGARRCAAKRSSRPRPCRRASGGQAGASGTVCAAGSAAPEGTRTLEPLESEGRRRGVCGGSL